MTVVDARGRTNHEGRQLRTVVCAGCGARHGEDFQYFSWHVLHEHSPADFGLSPLGERPGGDQR